MNKSVLEFISMFSKFNNNSDLHLTDLKISGTDWYESAWRGQQNWFIHGLAKIIQEFFLD